MKKAVLYIIFGLLTATMAISLVGNAFKQAMEYGMEKKCEDEKDEKETEKEKDKTLPIQAVPDLNNLQYKKNYASQKDGLTQSPTNKEIDPPEIG